MPESVLFNSSIQDNGRFCCSINKSQSMTNVNNSVNSCTICMCILIEIVSIPFMNLFCCFCTKINIFFCLQRLPTNYELRSGKKIKTRNKCTNASGSLLVITFSFCNNLPLSLLATSGRECK